MKCQPLLTSRLPHFSAFLVNLSAHLPAAKRSNSLFLSERESGSGNSGLYWEKGTGSGTPPVVLQASSSLYLVLTFVFIC